MVCMPSFTACSSAKQKTERLSHHPAGGDIADPVREQRGGQGAAGVFDADAAVIHRHGVKGGFRSAANHRSLPRKQGIRAIGGQNVLVYGNPAAAG